MRTMKLRKTLTTVAVIGATFLGTAALAQPPHGGYGGPGMTGAWSHQGWEPGYGMMGAWGPGHGMMGAYGMMGAWGHHGWGPGMMHGWAGAPALNLSKEQTAKIAKIEDEALSKHWDIVAKMREAQARMNALYYADPPNDAAISKSYAQILDLRQQMFDLSLKTRKQIDVLLTKEQREQLESFGCGAFGD